MIIEAPNNIGLPDDDKPSVFLAGTIDMGNSIDWQAYAITKLETLFHIYNPRRADWDSTWEQSIDNPQFNEQVNWELDALDCSDVILMNFLSDSYSPITLLELGLHAESGRLIVVCPREFWRKGNVDIVCYRYGIQLYETLDEAIEYLKQNVGTF